MLNKLQILDVTLRDGGHTCDFDWPMEFAQEYYDLMCQLGVSYVELGYWKQSAKSQNRFYKLNQDTVNEITGGKGKKNVSVMIDKLIPLVINQLILIYIPNYKVYAMDLVSFLSAIIKPYQKCKNYQNFLQD